LVDAVKAGSINYDLVIVSPNSLLTLRKTFGTLVKSGVVPKWC